MLTLAYAEPEPNTIVDIREPVYQLGRVARRVLGPHIAYTMFAEGHACIGANASQVEQILLNLVADGRDATSAGGCVTVHISRERHMAPKRYAHDLVPAGDWVCLRVTDTGHGIAKHILPRVFEERFSTESVGGRGFGLAYRPLCRISLCRWR
jgi:two-component system cell cycle sensor histidine kinase/response regulator CckA